MKGVKVFSEKNVWTGNFFNNQYLMTLPSSLWEEDQHTFGNINTCKTEEIKYSISKNG
jgi:hypothetical protein